MQIGYQIVIIHEKKIEICLVRYQTIMTTVEQINPNKYYTITEVSRMGILPWSSPMTFGKKLKEQRWIEIFNPFVEMIGRREFKKIRGENIIKFLTKIENENT